YEDGWMTRRFFTAGTMPSDDLLPRFDHDLALEEHWRVSGRHYARTAEAWLARPRPNPAEIEHVLRPAPVAERRVILLPRAGLWGYRGGSEWLVSHYRFAKRAS